MRDQLIDLCENSFLDDDEGEELLTMINEKLRKLTKLPSSISPPQPEMIIKNIYWIDDNDLIQYLNHFADFRKLMPKDVFQLYTDKDVLTTQNDRITFEKSLYIIVSGLIIYEYESYDSYTSDDRVGPKSKKYIDTLTSGSIVGEFSLLLDYQQEENGRLTCETASQLYVIGFDKIRSAFNLYDKLELNLWKSVSIKIASDILSQQSKYKKWSKAKIKALLHRSDLYINRCTSLEQWQENGCERKIDLNRNSFSDIILIYGKAIVERTKNFLQGPIYLQADIEELTLIPSTDHKTSFLSAKHVVLSIPTNFTILSSIDSVTRLSCEGSSCREHTDDCQKNVKTSNVSSNSPFHSRTQTPINSK